MPKVGDTVVVGGVKVKITGKSGEYYRVFVNGPSKYHDWYHQSVFLPL